MVGGLAVLRAVDELLGMLDAHANGERLLLHMHARIAHELERVAGRMAARQHNAICGDQLGGVFGFGGSGFAGPGLKSLDLSGPGTKILRLAGLRLSGFRTVSATSPKRLGGLEAGDFGLG